MIYAWEVSKLLIRGNEACMICNPKGARVHARFFLHFITLPCKMRSSDEGNLGKIVHD